MIYTTIPISIELRKRLNKEFYKLKANGEIKTWDGFLEILLKQFKINLKGLREI